MIKNDAIVLLLQARKLLDRVYSEYVDPEVSSSLSVADTCIESALAQLGVEK